MARSIVVLKLSTRVKNVIVFAQNVAAAMTGNVHLPSPTPTLATFQADIAALNAAETAVLSRAKGAVETRNAKFAVLRTDLENLRAYVQTVSDANAATDAAAIVEGGGMTLRKATVKDKPALAAKLGSVSGTVNLAAKSVAKKAAYTWEYSTDQKTWTALPETLVSKAGVTGLTPNTQYYFRVQALTANGLGTWSQVISLQVQ